MRDRQAVTLREPLGDQRAMTGLGIGLDAEQRRGGLGGQLGDERIEVGVVEDLVDVALAVFGVEHGARALADADRSSAAYCSRRSSVDGASSRSWR